MKLLQAAILIVLALGVAGCKAERYFPADMKLPDGSEYHGELVDGQFEGKGVQIFPSGAIYSGDFHAGSWHGKGSYVVPDDWRYDGDFENGMFEGAGVMETETLHYTGTFKQNKFHGEGELQYRSGDSYKGEFSAGKFHGQGEYSVKDGAVYSGLFEQGELLSGTEVTEEGVYSGGFTEWRYQGEGRYEDADGGIYVGEFADGTFTGEGSYDGNGEHYQGAFESWYYHGKGMLTYDDGRIVEAEFFYGDPRGKGTLTTVDTTGKRHRQTGHWYDDEFVPGDAPSPREKKEQVVDTILLEDQKRLAAQLAGLKPQTPGQRDVYFLAVGGDGKEGVFRRDIEVARQALASKYDLDGRTVILLNSRDYDTFPLATSASVRAALTALDGKMDAGEDLLFVHLTSHGGRKGNFVLDQPGMALADLMPKDFADGLKALAIKKKVVVISACYSGQWLDELKSGGLMMLMSARRDRTSFGCGDDSEMTWFTKAVYQQGGVNLERPDDWFSRVDESIRAWELAENFDEDRWSHPQFFAGAEIRAWLEGRRTPASR